MSEEIKKFSLGFDHETIKGLDLNQYLYTLHFPTWKQTRNFEEGYKRLYVPDALSTSKYEFAKLHQFIGKYEFLYDLADAGLYFRIRRLPENSNIHFQDEPYIYPECWDATPFENMRFYVSEYNGILTHCGRSSIDQIKHWMKEVAPKIRNFVFKPHCDEDYNNIVIREATEEEKQKFDENLCKKIEEEHNATPDDGAISTEDAKTTAPAEGDFFMVIEDPEHPEIVKDDPDKWTQTIFGASQSDVETIAKDLLEEYIEDDQEYDFVSVKIYELNKIGVIKQKKEVVTTTEWFHKTEADSDSDKPKPNGAGVASTSAENSEVAHAA